MSKFTGLLAGAAITAAALSATAQDAPFGTEADKSYANDLWAVMASIGMVGDNQIHTIPYEGVEPHGMVLETFFTTATVNGHTGQLIVKRNYGPAGVAVEEVQANPSGHLGAVTVMFQREDGYDADNQNWFWVKYLPDGSFDKNPAGMELAGRVAKGADAGCLACHVNASGDDYTFVDGD